MSNKSGQIWTAREIMIPSAYVDIVASYIIDLRFDIPINVTQPVNNDRFNIGINDIQHP